MESRDCLGDRFIPGIIWPCGATAWMPSRHGRSRPASKRSWSRNRSGGMRSNPGRTRPESAIEEHCRPSCPGPARARSRPLGQRDRLAAAAIETVVMSRPAMVAAGRDRPALLIHGWGQPQTHQRYPRRRGSTSVSASLRRRRSRVDASLPRAKDVSYLDCREARRAAKAGVRRICSSNDAGEC